MRSADRAHLLLLGGDSEGRLQIVPVGTPVAGEAGEHQPQTVQQFRHRPERAPDSRHSRPLMQRQGCRHIAHVIDLRPRRLRHPAPRIGGQRLQVSPRPLGIQHSQRQRTLSRARHPGDPHDLPQGNVHIDILQVVRPCPAHLDTVLFHSGDKGTHFLRGMRALRRATAPLP